MNIYSFVIVLMNKITLEYYDNSSVVSIYIVIAEFTILWLLLL